MRGRASGWRKNWRTKFSGAENCEILETICTTNPQHANFWSILDENKEIDSTIFLNFPSGFETFGFPKNKIRNRHLKTINWIAILSFGARNSISTIIVKIVFSNSSRISLREPKIRNRRHWKPQYLSFHTKIQIFPLPKSWFCIRLVYRCCQMRWTKSTNTLCGGNQSNPRLIWRSRSPRFIKILSIFSSVASELRQIWTVSQVPDKITKIRSVVHGRDEVPRPFASGALVVAARLALKSARHRWWPLRLQCLTTYNINYFK